LLKQNGPDAIPGYLRNVRLDLYKRARRIILDIGQRPFCSPSSSRSSPA
jgi:hypothetical protein